MSLEADDKRYLWHPFTQQQDWEAEPQLVITEAQGCYLIDAEGRRYLDGVSSLWANLHGHRHPVIDAAIKQQLAKVAHTTMLGLTHPSSNPTWETSSGSSSRTPEPCFLL